MEQTSGCPGIQQLLHLVLGKMPAAEVQRLTRHLVGCPACVGTLHGLKVEDTLIQVLREQAPTDRSAEDLIDSLIRRLRESATEPGSSQTIPPEVGEPAPEPEMSWDFLLPPQAEGELGRLGPYRILRLLGRGAMGLVLEAEDIHLQRRAALKVVQPKIAADLGTRQRFLREARAAAALKHDHIVTIYQVGQENDVPFLAMEYLKGETLETRLEREGRLPAAEVLRIGREIAEGLAAAHDHRLIHRDIKPANIWLEVGTRRVKILDFGLARSADGNFNLTGTGLIVGTPQYMAPEQAQGEPLDARCDLFSLGSVMYRMCSGDLAFAGSTTMAVLTALAVRDPRPLTEVVPGIPPDLATLVQALLAKDRADRPATARAVVDAIRAVEAGMPVPVTSPSRSSGTTVLTPAAVPASPPTPARRRLWVGAAAALAVAVTAGVTWWQWGSREEGGESTPAGPIQLKGPPIRVGVLHDLSGTLSEEGNSVVEAIQLAIDEINQRGGVLGCPVQAIVRDGQSDPDVYPREGERLIVHDRVSVIFGCWTSASRKALRPVVEKYDHLLIYPVQYEGLELSPNIIYNGATPNQQIIPAVQYCFGFLNRRRFFLVGSDYVFPHAANAIIRDKLKSLGGEVVGEEYLLLGSAKVGGVVRKIAESKADVILNTINGDTNRPFFRALRAAGIRPEQVPTVSFSLAENSLRHLGARDVVGDYAAWNYFQSIDRPENREFVQRFQARYGAQRVVSDPMQAAYVGVQLWVRAVEAAGKDEPRAVRRAFGGLEYNAPEGPVRVDPETGHTWKTIRLGKVVEGGQFEIIWSSGRPVRPEPYPSTRSRAEWDAFVQELRRGWGGHWANPATGP